MISGGAVVGLAAAGGWLLAGCTGDSQGVRTEGPARTQWTAPSAQDHGSYAGGGATKPPAVQKADAVRLIKDDPKVAQDLKTHLQPCTAPGKGKPVKGYPVEVARGKLTGPTASDLVINVTTCDDGFGIGSYVYRKAGRGYENVFSDEQPPVYADVVKGDLSVTKLSYASGDTVCCPSREDVITYRWASSRQAFTVVRHKHTDYSKGSPTEEPAPSASATDGGEDDGTEG
ncbi:hypothetical protein [Streptomyces sp. NBRC 110028]|uniref:hypothetical protein n=1 Tax=Streptomyces sp. NBRC 110028 TaxID=1621260 RepID=UPI0006E1506F|nr:hypothetical protein [Streptomyces sp. NBRC 110028]